MKDILAREFFNNTVGNWLIALSFALGAIVVARALYWAISKYVKKITAKTETKLDDREALQRFCLLVLNLNEFLYLD